MLLAIGLVWIGQGLGYIPGSFMTGDRFWAGVGAVLVVGGGVMVVLETRRRG